jgi:hypothetical protein
MLTNLTSLVHYHTWICCSQQRRPHSGIPNQTFLERRAAARLVYYGLQYVNIMAQWSDAVKSKFLLKALGKKYVRVNALQCGNKFYNTFLTHGEIVHISQ